MAKGKKGGKSDPIKDALARQQQIQDLKGQIQVCIDFPANQNMNSPPMLRPSCRI
jgi:hypothetical protein